MSGYPYDGNIYEDYDEHWGFMDFKDKRVLDIAADVGSTPHYFMSKGAKDVIAVSGHGEYDALVQNIKKYDMKNVTPVNMWVSSTKDFVDLITTYKPDILKCDCDPENNKMRLTEWFLLEAPDDVLRTVPEYAIEWHDQQLPGAYRPPWRHLSGLEVLRYAWPIRFKELGYTTSYHYHDIAIYARKNA